MTTHAGTTSADAGAEADGLKRRNVPRTEVTPAEEIREELDVKKEQGKQVCALHLEASTKGIAVQLSCRLHANRGCQPQAGKSILSFLDEYEFIIAPILFTLLSFFTRMYKIGLSPIVTWDEAQ